MWNASLAFKIGEFVINLHDKERLKHIFERQLYGLAPTEIIYRIALNFLLGFDKNHEIDASHFRKLDALKYAKAGTLREKIDELFGEG